VSYGPFRYFSGGDINGVYQQASNDVEAVVGPRVGSVDVSRGA
jgi:hypothetical protein